MLHSLSFDFGLGNSPKLKQKQIRLADCFPYKFELPKLVSVEFVDSGFIKDAGVK